jgi:hypothetical protein
MTALKPREMAFADASLACEFVEGQSPVKPEGFCANANPVVGVRVPSTYDAATSSYRHLQSRPSVVPTLSRPMRSPILLKIRFPVNPFNSQ